MGEALFLSLLFGLGFLMYRVFKHLVTSALYDVELGDSGVMMVILRLARYRVMPYSAVADVAETTRIAIYAKAAQEHLSISGATNRSGPLVVIRRRDRRAFYVCTPRDPKQFVAQLKDRVRASETSAAR